MQVSPFRYLRITAHLQLPVAFRSLSRLSSALSAKASTLRSYCLTIFLDEQRFIQWFFVCVNKPSLKDFSFGFSKTFVLASDVLFISVFELLRRFSSSSFKISRYLRLISYSVFKVQISGFLTCQPFAMRFITASRLEPPYSAMRFITASRLFHHVLRTIHQSIQSLVQASLTRVCLSW